MEAGFQVSVRVSVSRGLIRRRRLCAGQWLHQHIEKTVPVALEEDMFLLPDLIYFLEEKSSQHTVQATGRGPLVIGWIRSGLDLGYVWSYILWMVVMGVKCIVT